MVEKRFRNRIAAAKCRQKKIDRVAELERVIAQQQTLIEQYQTRCRHLEELLSNASLSPTSQENSNNSSSIESTTFESSNTTATIIKEEPDLDFTLFDSIDTSSTAASSNDSLNSWQMIAALEKKTCLYTIF